MVLKCTKEYCYDTDVVSFAIVLGICATVVVLWVFWLIQKSRFFRRIGYQSPEISSASDTQSESQIDEKQQNKSDKDAIDDDHDKNVKQ